MKLENPAKQKLLEKYLLDATISALKKKRDGIENHPFTEDPFQRAIKNDYDGESSFVHGRGIFKKIKGPEAIRICRDKTVNRVEVDIFQECDMLQTKDTEPEPERDNVREESQTITVPKQSAAPQIDIPEEDYNYASSISLQLDSDDYSI